jgi:APA family basic amino acid/polyamine antiporter
LAEHGFFSAFFTAMMAAFWAYEGWNNLGFMGGEIKNPTKTIPRALVLGVSIVMLVYIAVNAAFLWVLPVEDFMAMAQQKNSIAAAEVIKVLFGPVAMVVILALIIVATLNATNSSLMSASRVWFAMARDGLFLASAGRTNKANVPGNALVLMGVWSALLVLSGSFDQLTDMLVFAAFLFYGAGAFGVFVLRRKMPDAVRLTKVPGYPVVPALFVAFCAALVANSVIERPREAGIGLALILIGIPFYKKRKVKA